LLQAQILSYYRNRADAFDTDRASLYAKLDEIRLKQDLVHKAEWECRKRTEEKAQLEAALEQCQTVLYLERENILQTKRKCDEMRLKQNKNKKDILDMLSNSNSVEQHVYYNQQQAPEKIQSYAKKTNGLAADQESLKDLWKSKTIEAGHGVPRVSVLQANSTASYPNILRTVHLPNEKVGQIRGENNNLNA
jgi:hypothetical protein